MPQRETKKHDYTLYILPHLAELSREKNTDNMYWLYAHYPLC